LADVRSRGPCAGRAVSAVDIAPVIPVGGNARARHDGARVVVGEVWVAFESTTFEGLECVDVAWVCPVSTWYLISGIYEGEPWRPGWNHEGAARTLAALDQLRRDQSRRGVFVRWRGDQS